MRVVKVDGGFALTEKTPAQLAAQANAAKRLGGVGATGPLAVHEFLASQGGLSKSAMADLGMDRNMRVGSRWLFTNGGMSLERATELMQQHGYMDGTEQNKSIDLIQRSARGDKQYTPEGWDAIAQAEHQSRFEDHLAAQEEAGANALDEFHPDAIMAEDIQAVPEYDSATQDIQLQVAALMEHAESLGIDTESLREQAASATQDQSDQAYYEHVKQLTESAISDSARSGRDGLDSAEDSGQGRRDAEHGSGADGREDAGGQGYALDRPTESDVLSRQDRAGNADQLDQREQIRRESEAGADQFQLEREDGRQDSTGSLFSRREEDRPEQRIADYLEKFPIRPPSGMTREQFREFIDGRQAGMRDLVHELAPNAEGMLLPVRGGGFWGITKEVRPDGEDWRVTRFDSRMEPQGHEAHKTAESALEDVIQWTDKDRLQDMPKFSRREEDQPRNLVALHNLTEENLHHADRMGGMPVPSIGITKVDHPFSGFGDISLIAHKNLVDPKTGVPVFDRDAWTARFPEMNFKKVRAAKADAFYERMKPAKEMGNDGDQFASMLWDELVNRKVQKPDQVAELFKRYDAPKILYAREVLGKDVKTPTKPYAPQLAVSSDPQVRTFYKRNRALLEGDRTEAQAQAFREFSQIVDDAVDRVTASAGERAAVRAKLIRESIFNDDGSLNGSAYQAIERDMPKVGTKVVDNLKLREAVRKAVPDNDPSYAKWVKDQVAPLFDAPTITVRGREVAPTLDNIVDAMTVGGTQGAEKSMTFGAGKLAAHLGQRFKSLEDIQAARDRVVSQDQEAEAKKGTDAILENFRSSAARFFTEKDYRGNIDTWAANDASMEALAKAGKLALTDGNIRMQLQRMGFKGVDSQTLDLAKKAIESIRNSSTDYFEAKPQRAVALNEFKGAVIPRDTSDSARAVLDKHGIPYLEYNRKAEGSREAAIQKMTKRLDKADPGVLFSRREGEDQTDTPEFKRWFGDSKITDENGDPKVMYHGTAQDISTFRAKQAGAIFVTDDPEFAHEFAVRSEFHRLSNEDAPDASQNIMPVYVKAEKPFDYQNPEDRERVIDIALKQNGMVRPDGERAIMDDNGKPTLYTKGVIDYGLDEGHGDNNWSLIETPWMQDAIKAAGYDGFYVKEDGRKNLAVYDPAQLKSATGNNGRFDPENPDIRYSRKQDDQTETPEFRRWFGDSKVVDNEGKPLVVYHGTASSFDAVDMKETKRLPGFWLTTEPRLASSYAAGGVVNAKSYPEGANVMPLYARIERPFVFNPKKQSFNSAWDEYQSGNYDGFIEHGNDSKGVTTLVVKTPEQIKSAIGNNGQFDPANPDIRFSRKENDGVSMLQSAKDKLADFLETPRKILSEAKLAVVPLSEGSDQAKKAATDFARNTRLADWQWKRFDDILVKHFDDSQRQKMWEAADEENDLRRDGITDDTRGLGRLTPEERDAVETLHQYGEALLQRARDAGMFEGQGVPYWTPRMAAMVDDEGNYFRVPGGSPKGGPEGRNVTTSASSLKQRKYLTSAETEQAMAGLSDKDRQAFLVRDIRTMPLAMARLERAITGRDLVNQVKALGRANGTDVISDHKQPDFITINHPAFEVWRPRLEKGADGKWSAVKDENGDPIMEKQPLYIRKDWAGPLSAVMTKPSGEIYKAFMSLKAKTMGLIMYSPVIHNAVEYGRAFPAVMEAGSAKDRLSLGLYTYFAGYRAKNDPAIMSEAIKNGLVPIGGRGQMQDITGVAAGPDLVPGRSLTAKVLAAPISLISEKAGLNVKKAVDAAGKFWHETLLWNRVGDLQMGLYTMLKSSYLNKGMNEREAGQVAAHFANRFAGSIPPEAMSSMATKVLNFALFSRTFTVGNMAVLKDCVTGLPSSLQATIRLEGSELAAQAAKSAGRRTALAALALDMGLMYATNSLVQDWLDDEKKRGYADRWNDLKDKIKANPWQAIHLFDNLESLTSNADNEEGKQGRIKAGTESDGTQIYVRLPFGKIGEEMKNYMTDPAKQLAAKESTFLRPIIEILKNDKGFGRQVWDDKESVFAPDNLGRILSHWAKAQVPTDQIVSAWDLANGHGDDMDVKKIIGPLLGLTYSKGAPGGPEVGQMYQADRDYQQRKTNAMPDVKRAIKLGDEDKAMSILLDQVGMSPREANRTINLMENPEMRNSRTLRRNFDRHATEDQKAKMDSMR